MPTLLLLAAGLLAANPEKATTPADVAAYEAARVRVGRDADAHIKLALWCEAHGLKAERLRHLAIAVVTDPRNATARGLLGLVAYRGQWRDPKSVSEKVQSDADLSAALAEYNARRARTRETADGHWDLATWSEMAGLKAEASAHFAAVVRLDPSRDAAWKRLGCKKVGGRWLSDEQIAAQRAEQAAQSQANKHWQPLLTQWRGRLRDKRKRAEAEAALAEVTDPRAVPAVVATLAASYPAVAVRVLGQIDAPASSRALATMAVSNEAAEVRRLAAETLRSRDPREFAGLLIAVMRDPIKYEVRPVGGPGSPGALFVKGEQFNVQRLYAPPPMPNVAVFPGDTMGYDAYGLPVLEHTEWFRFGTGRQTAAQLFQHVADNRQRFDDYGQKLVAISPRLADFPKANLDRAVGALSQTSTSLPPALSQAIVNVQKSENHRSLNDFGFGMVYQSTMKVQTPVGQMMLEAQKSAVTAQAQLESDKAVVDEFNSDVRENSGRIARILTETTGQDLGESREAWQRWWVNQIGYSYKTPDVVVPTIVENVPLNYEPQPVPVTWTGGTEMVGFTRMSCFGGGTRVRTLQGSSAIETLRVGDQVLTQDLKTGALGYRPILVVHHNPPSPTFLIKLADGGETIVSSPFHRFWKSGQGWAMARDLNAGDTLRMLDGPARVESVESGPVQPVFNLDVAEDHDFFAGDRGALVHDNTVPELRLAPFDAAASLDPKKPSASR